VRALLVLVLASPLLGACPARAEDATPSPKTDPAPSAPPGTSSGDEDEIQLEAHPIAPETPPVLRIPTRGGGTDYEIGRQDLLDISVFDLKELNQTVRVADDGAISLPLLGRLQVAGLRKGELETQIARLLEERFVRNPQVTVFVREYVSKRVAVSGAVKKPDTYEMLGGKTLLEMISLAGGLDRDLGDEIIIFRQRDDGGADRIAVDLERLVYDADPSLNLEVVPGDIIYVPTVETIRIFVTGAVRTPNVFEVPRAEPVTVLRAITLAGGTTDRASERRIQIIRTGPDGGRVMVAVDLRKVKRGKAPDPVLQKDDLVLVPESFF
jgi:polysaccharide export outer membrane protein